VNLEVEEKISLEEQRKIYKEEIYPIAPNYRDLIIANDEVISDSFQKLEQLGIVLLKFPSKSANLSGFHIKKSNIDCIYINTNTTLGRQYFSCWHEYYHAITGEGSGISFFDRSLTDKIECKADLFAGYVLMPENLVENFMKINNISRDKLTYENIIEMQHYFNVSYKAMIKRLQIIYGKIPNEDILYSLSSKERPFELTNYTIKMGYSTKLSKKTYEVYIPQKFLSDLESNVKNKRISESKKKSIQDFLDYLEHAENR